MAPRAVGLLALLAGVGAVDLRSGRLVPADVHAELIRQQQPETGFDAGKCVTHSVYRIPDG